VSLRQGLSKSMWSRSVCRPVLMLAMSLAALVFLSACGNYGNNVNSVVACPGATGNFNNASLPAGSQWTYDLSGWFLTPSLTYAPYTAAGVFTVDGSGHITSGFDDGFASGFTGTYSISNNGTGSITINFTSGASAGNSLSWAVTLNGTNPGALYVIEADSAFNASGTAYQQNPAAFAVAPNGTFVFRAHVLTSGTSLSGSSATVGVMAVNAGNITSLNEDVLPGGSAPSQRTLGPVTNPAFSAPDSDGVGTVTLVDNQNLTTSYNYYVIDANNYLLYETDQNNIGLGLGRMEAQSGPGGGFTNASLSGGYVFGSRGDTVASTAFGVTSLGQFNTDSAGNVSSGSYDTVRDGSPNLNATITSTGTASTYSVAANGRTTITLNASGTIVQETAYLVSGARGFFLVSNDTSRVEDGTLDQQPALGIPGSGFTGQFAFVMGGSSAGTPIDRTGTLTSDGNGNLGWAEVVNSGGTVNVPGCLAGTYAIATNGRVAASVNNLSGALVFYMVSPSKSYLMQGDPASEIFGGATTQGGPAITPPGAF
jgi:hypothetical protein